MSHWGNELLERVELQRQTTVSFSQTDEASRTGGRGACVGRAAGPMPNPRNQFATARGRWENPRLVTRTALPALCKPHIEVTMSNIRHMSLHRGVVLGALPWRSIWE